MKIVLTGGGSGGHFYPLIAVGKAIRELANEKRLLRPQLFYIAPTPYDERVLFENDIEFRQSPAGKMRHYFSLVNLLDVFKTFFGVIKATFQLFSIFPDVVFSKGGYSSFPTVAAARILRIPVVIHESDAHPGRANVWAGKFAHAIGISYPEASAFFPKDKTALVGNPVRPELFTPRTEGAHEFFNLDPALPTIFIVGGSQGAQRINEVVLDALGDLTNEWQVIHQTGQKNFVEVEGTSRVILTDPAKLARYHPLAYLNEIQMRAAAGAASIVVSRAGSGAIFEVAAWGKPSIIVPIPDTISADQRKNAFAYAREGAGVVIEEHNLTPHVLIAEINRVLSSPELLKSMSAAAKAFARPNAAKAMAEELLSIALEHEE